VGGQEQGWIVRELISLPPNVMYAGR